MADRDPKREFDLVGGPKEATDADDSPMTFSALVLSLSTSALFHLGTPVSDELARALGLEVSDARGTPPIDLAMGKQTIEMLELLRVKTRGNLDAEETQLLDRAIHDLKMRFVEIKRAGTAATAQRPSARDRD